MAPPSPPLVTHMYTADPSAHVFNNRIYIYPSHDRETDHAFNDNGDQYDMVDYHVFSMASLPLPLSSSSSAEGQEEDETPSAPPSKVTDHGIALTLADVPWASKQLWAPDAASKNGKYYLYFPARDTTGVFRIGVAVGEKPEGPFSAQESWIEGTYSIDPAVFVDGDGDGEAYLLFGGIWGGQLQCWGKTGTEWVFDASRVGPQEPSGANTPALFPRIARLSSDMLALDTDVRELAILDPATDLPLMADDHERRFFEASWMHKYNGKYYFSYSTGDTHYIVYAVSESIWGPYYYRGRLMEPVSGWTTHHSIVEFGGRWWLFFHDCELSGGVDHLRSVRVREVGYDAAGDMFLV